jgi:NADPH:quinone reductase-like Zn-dependent oxidoreductase
MIRVAALFGAHALSRHHPAEATTITLTAGVDGAFGILNAPVPPFGPLGAHEVRLRVLAFSCNYRDRARLTQEARAGRHDRITPFGSEFCAVIEQVGARVRDLTVGQRVVGDNALSRHPDTSSARGIPTNESSLECLHLDSRRLVAIPDSLSTDAAAGFSLAAQTASAMVRRVRLTSRHRCLITSGRSMTSLMAVQLAHARGAQVTVATTQAPTAAELDAWRALGATSVVRTPDDETAVDTVGGFDVAIDPFHDLHLDWVATAVRLGGQIVTCGYATQGDVDDHTRAVRAERVRRGLQHVMVRNITLHGHCLGTRADLRDALQRHALGELHVPLAGVHAVGNFPAYLTTAFLQPRRWGKAIFRYA